MEKVVDRGSAGVHGDLAFLERHEQLLLAGHSVVDVHEANPLLFKKKAAVKSLLFSMSQWKNSMAIEKII
jgi:hypothetical protein